VGKAAAWGLVFRLIAGNAGLPQKGRIREERKHFEGLKGLY